MKRDERRRILADMTIALDEAVDRVKPLDPSQYFDEDKWSMEVLQYWLIRDLEYLRRQREIRGGES